jgi:sugar phosphate isomerase/epimerase
MHERISVNAVCFPRASLAEIAANWRELGAPRVSVPSGVIPDDIGELRAVLAAGGHRLETAIHLFFAYRGLERRADLWADEQAKLNRTIDAMAALGGRSVYMTTGGHGGLVWEEAAEIFTEAVAPCVVHARALGVELMTEPVPTLYADAHIAHTLGETIRLAEMAGIGVCIDIASSWTESDLKQSIERAMPLCSLVQVGDYVLGDRCMPYRAVPGDGDIPLARIFDWLLGAGFKGAFDLELIGPRIDEEGHLAAVRRAADYVDHLLEKLGA